MKSRDLKTIPNLIVSNYKLEPLDNGKFLHTFTPYTTNTVYTFVANGIRELEEGKHYNVGYYEDENNNKIVDLSSTAEINEVKPSFSYAHAKYLSEAQYKINKEKNDTRVIHQATDGYYWGKKYAWRQFGLAIPKSVFYAYLEHINHPYVECQTINPDLPFTNNEYSIAYKEEGLDEAIKTLLLSAEKASKTLFTSPHHNKRFTIRPPESITDKK